LRFFAAVALALLVLCSTNTNHVAAEDKRDSVTISGVAERDSVARQIDTIDDLIRKEDWSKAIDQCQALLGKNAETLAPVSADHLVQTHILVHQRIAGLPAPALKMYRNRVDGQAKKLYEEGLAKRDVAMLKRLIWETFCSKSGEDCLELLGDLAFEQGRFEEARRWWRMIALPASESLKPLPKENPATSAMLLYPNSQKNLAIVRAKQLLGLIFVGDRAKFDSEMKSFKEIHGKAEGTLAGQKGNLAKILEGVSKSIEPPNKGPMLSSWPTLAGAADRQGAYGCLPSHPNWLAHLCAEPPCRIDLVGHQVVADQRHTEPERPKATSPSFPYFPAIVDRFVLVAYGSGVALYDSINGKSTVWQSNDPKKNIRLPLTNEPDHTVTVCQSKAFACLSENNKLVCLDVDFGDNPSLQKRWQVGASSAGEKEPWGFEGSPVVANGRALVSISQKTASQTNHALICYNAETGTTLWRREVCHAARLDAVQASPSSNLLALAEGRVYFCSHSGVIACLDSFSGQMIWAVRYPVRSASLLARGATLRPSCPCLVANGRLFAAPFDSDRLLCFDAFCGQLLWSREGQEGVHLLGVGQNRLIFTTKQGIRWLETATGADVQARPDGGTGSLPSQGRGLLAGDLAFWPTRQGLFVLTQKDGEFPDDLNVYQLLKGQPLGNLALTSKVLAVAGPHEMSIYVSPALKRDQLRKELGKDPKSIKVLMRQAWANLDSLNFREAADGLAFAAELVRGLHDPQEKQALPAILSEQHFALRQMAERSGQHFSVEEAEGYLARAAGSSFSPSQQLLAGFKKAEMILKAGRVDQAIAAWQSIVSESRFRLERVNDEKGLSQPAAWLAAQKIDAVMPDSRPEKYQAIASKARERLAAAGPDNQKKGKSNEIRGMWQRGYEIALQPDEQLLVERGGSSSDYFFTANKRLLVCRNSSNGAIRWQRIFPDDPGWIARQMNLVAVGGASCIAVLSLEDGEILWQYRPKFVDDRPSALGCFQVQDNRIFCMEGQRQILAFDLGKGACIWRRGLLGANLGLPRAPSSWVPHFVVQKQFVLVNSLASKVQILDAWTGSLLHDVDLGAEIAIQPWKCINSNLKCLIVSASQLRMMDLVTGKPDWTHVFEGSSSLRNELPTILGHDDNLAVLIRRNYGDTLLRLEPRTGQKLWSEEQWLGVVPCNPTSIVLSPSAILLASDNSLISRSLADGRVLWERALPEAYDGWSLSFVNEDIICWPNQVKSASRKGTKSLSWAFSHPWGSLECQFSYPEDRCDLMTTPLIIADVRTGEPSQRFHLDSDRTSLAITNRPGIKTTLSSSTNKKPPTDGKNLREIGIQADQILMSSNGALWSIHHRPVPKQALSEIDRD
jgi:outer membrane protein assembly factor BamB/tetratricopeptide (TPR) repeat protein